MVQNHFETEKFVKSFIYEVILFITSMKIFNNLVCFASTKLSLDPDALQYSPIFCLIQYNCGYK